jgi:hypothetical protein
MTIPLHDLERLERYPVTCWECSSLTWFDDEEELPFILTCWRCGAIMNPDL